MLAQVIAKDVGDHLKNDTDVAHYNFIVHKPILAILTELLPNAERVCYQMEICYPTSPN